LCSKILISYNNALLQKDVRKLLAGNILSNLDNKLKNRIKIGLLLGLTLIATLIWKWVFYSTIIVAFLYSMYEINSKVKEKNNSNIHYLLIIPPLAYLLLGIIAASTLRIYFIEEFMYAVFATVINDVFAFFGGKKFGKNKLAPIISPNKTQEGALTGIIGVTIFTIIYGVIFFPQYRTITGIIIGLTLLGLFTASAGICGDLLESWYKRKIGVKDLGWILGEHGGIIDRIDSHILALTFLTLYFHILNLITIP